MGSSFEYIYTRLASRLRRSARWKCLETGEMINPLEYGKCLETGEITKSIEVMTFQGILLFLLFLDYFHIQGDLSFPCFQTLPPSWAPQARSEACVSVFKRRSHLGPPAKGRLGPSLFKNFNSLWYISNVHSQDCFVTTGMLMLNIKIHLLTSFKNYLNI